MSTAPTPVFPLGVSEYRDVIAIEMLKTFIVKYGYEEAYDVLIKEAYDVADKLIAASEAIR